MHSYFSRYLYSAIANDIICLHFFLLLRRKGSLFSLLDGAARIPLLAISLECTDL